MTIWTSRPGAVAVLVIGCGLAARSSIELIVTTAADARDRFCHGCGGSRLVPISEASWRRRSPSAEPSSLAGTARERTRWHSPFPRNASDRVAETYVTTADGVPRPRVSGERRSAPDPDPCGVPRAAAPLPRTEDPGHRRLLRLGAGRQPRAGRTRAQAAAGARRRRRRRALRRGT